jgi:hypothetical protein
MTNTTDSTKFSKKFGFFVGERYYFKDDQEVKRVHQHFKALSANRQYFFGLRKE